MTGAEFVALLGYAAAGVVLMVAVVAAAAGVRAWWRWWNGIGPHSPTTSR